MFEIQSALFNRSLIGSKAARWHHAPRSKNEGVYHFSPLSCRRYFGHSRDTLLGPHQLLQKVCCMAC